MPEVNPDPNFVRHLKELSPDLDCYFDDDVKRFVVVCMNHRTGQYVPIYQIKNPDGSFKRPGPMDIDFIAAGDTWSDKYVNATEYCDGYIMKRKKETMEEFRNRTKDDKYQLVRKFAAITGDASKIQPFRKMPFKPQGKVF